MESTIPTPPASAPATARAQLDERVYETMGQRWRRLLKRHGPLGAFLPFLVGERDEVLTERETKLPGYSTVLIYVMSAAAAIVSGSADIIELTKAVTARDLTTGVIAGLMLATLLLMVYAIDKGLARTIPRIGLLASRGEWLTLVEALLFCAAVGAIEITTLTILILNENKVKDILRGQPLIATGSGLFFAMTLGRAAMTFWSIVHSHLVAEKLPIQLSTAKREGAELFGGQLMALIRGVRDLPAVSPGSVMENFILFLSPAPRAPWRGEPEAGQERYSRRLKQLALDVEHRKALVKALDDLYARSGSTPPVQLAGESAEAEGQAASGDAPAADGADESGAPGGEETLATGPAVAGDENALNAGNSLDSLAPISGADDLRLKAFTLPDGMTLTTQLSQSELATALGVSAGALSQAFSGSGLTPYPARPGQARNAKNWEVWQALALVEAGRLELPALVSRRELSAVS